MRKLPQDTPFPIRKEDIRRQTEHAKNGYRSDFLNLAETNKSSTIFVTDVE